MPSRNQETRKTTPRSRRDTRSSPVPAPRPRQGEPAPAVVDVHRRRALSIGIPSFGAESVDGEPPPGSWQPLPFAGKRARALVTVLEQLGYDCDVKDEPISAVELGNAVREAIKTSGPDDVLIVHVLSHAYVTESGALYVVGGDGRHDEATDVERWIRNVVDHEKTAPLTLFLLDMCSAGGAARLDWQVNNADARREAWVIAACAPDEVAYGGRFTQAVTAVLHDIANEHIDLDPSYRNAPITTVARLIRRRVNELAAASQSVPQRVTATLIDISADPPSLPFFPNPKFADSLQHRRLVRTRIDDALVPFLDDLDEAFDPVHFVTRAMGQSEIDSDDSDEITGFFSGRSRELKILAPWLNLQDEVGLRVVTGSPGAGKSALIGVLVCAAHPVLREPTRGVWDHIEQAPYRNDLMAAVHARQRDLNQIAASIARQLRLNLPSGKPVATALIQAIAALPDPPVIVVDALDEAVNGVTVMDELLLPLANAVRPDGEPVRLLVGMRPWEDFLPLREAAEAGNGLLDLDAVPRRRLCRDIQQYVSRLLRHDKRWDRLETEASASTLARAVAETLTEGEVDHGWGAFLVAGLFTHHVLNAYPQALRDPDEALRLGRSVPRTLPEVLDLDLTRRGSDNPWLRPVLLALGHARASGMPAQLVQFVAAAFTDEKQPATTEAVLDALGEVRFYLRHSAEDDGTTHYRLFHQGLADHLRGTHDAGRVLDQLIAAVPEDATDKRLKRWDLAEPYLRRYAADHALEAGRLDELLRDPTFLVAAEPSELIERLPADSGAIGTAYRRAFEEGLAQDPRRRRQVLALWLVRCGATDVGRELVSLPGHDDLVWAPQWAANGNYTAAAIFMLQDRPAVALGTANGRVEVHDAASGAFMMEFVGQKTAVTAIAAGKAWGKPIIVSVGSDGRVITQEVETARTIATGVLPPKEKSWSLVGALALGELGGRPVLMAIRRTGSAALLDLYTGEEMAVIKRGMEGGYDYVRVGDDIAELVVNPFESIGVRSPGEIDFDLPQPQYSAALLTLGAAAGRLLLFTGDSEGFTGDSEGTVRAWDPAHGRIVDEITLRSPIRTLRADDNGRLLVVAKDFALCVEYRPGPRPSNQGSASALG